MNKRTRLIAKNLFVFLVAIISTVLLLKSFYVGFELVLCRNEVINTEYLAQEHSYIPELRAEANSVYEGVTTTRDGLYNSSDAFISWISTVNNFVSVSVTLMLMVVVALSYRYIYLRWCYVNSRNARK